jgi:hypothetical protein
MLLVSVTMLGNHIVHYTKENEEVTIVVYIHESLNEKNKACIQVCLSKLEGIVSIEFDGFRPHLVFIKFIPTLIQSSIIMSHINDHDLHPHLIVGF